MWYLLIGFLSIADVIYSAKIRDGSSVRELIGTARTMNESSHPHLYSGDSMHFKNEDLTLSNVKAEPGAAVIFHAMPHAGKNLLLAKLHRMDVTRSNAERDFVVYDTIKYNEGESSLHVVNVNNMEDRDPDSRQDDHIAAALSYIDTQGLNLKLIYVIIDTQAINDDYLDKLYAYIDDLRSQYAIYAPINHSTIKLVFNKVDTVDALTLNQRVGQVQDKLGDMFKIDKVIATSSHECVGRLVSSLRMNLDSANVLSHKALDQIRQRRILIDYQLLMENAILKCDQSKINLVKTHLDHDGLRTTFSGAILKCTSSALIDRHPMPNIEELQLRSPTEPRSRQTDNTDSLWTLNWIKSGANRAVLANRMFDMEHYQDTKEQYDKFVEKCTIIQQPLVRFGERTKIASMMNEKIDAFKSTNKQYEDDFKKEIHQFQRDIDMRVELVKQLETFQAQLPSM